MTDPKRIALQNLIESLPDDIKFNDFVQALYAFSYKNLPLFLYRYRGCNKIYAFDDIDECKITISSAAGFDDDLDDTAIHDKGKVDEIADRILNNQEYTVDTLRRMSGVFDKREDWEQFFRFVEHFYAVPKSKQESELVKLLSWIRNAFDIEPLSEKLRLHTKVACLCANGNSPYMWNKYADQGTGYLIEYMTPQLLSIDISNHKIPLILPVMYINDLPDTLILPVSLSISNEFNSTISKEAFDSVQAANFIKCVFCKSKTNFEDEEEWRLMLGPLEAERDQKYIKRSIKPFRLIIGPNMSSEDRDRLCKCAEKNNIMIAEYANTFDNVTRRAI